MTLQQLESFFWTVKLGSFATAADRMCATQSAVSMRIRELERDLGVELFDRSRRTAQVTAKGRELMDYASRILDLSAEAKQRIGAPATVSGIVRFGVAEVVTATWLPELIQTIARRHPAVKLEIEEALTADLMRDLRAGEVDLVLAPGAPVNHELGTLPLGAVDFAWMASPLLGFDRRTYSAAELAMAPVIGMKSESYHFSRIEDWFQREHVRCRYFALCKSLAVAASMTISGIGISFLPVRSYRPQLDLGTLVMLDVASPLPPVEFVALFPLGQSYSLAQTIAELATKVSNFAR